MEKIKITSQDYMKMQPDYAQQYPSDKFYFGVAQELAAIVSESAYAQKFGADIAKEAVLAVVGYYQDIVADAGLWRSFITMHKHLYGTLLPFYEPGEDYIESELNLADIRFLLWYVAECMQPQARTVMPYDDDILALATAIHAKLDEYYEFAPYPEGFGFIPELEVYNPEHAQQVYDFSYWLFWNSYLLRHAAVATMHHSLAEGQEIIRRHPDPDEARPLLLEMNHRIMSESPTGPLGLYIRDWLLAVTDNKLPKGLQYDDRDFLTRLAHLR